MTGAVTERRNAGGTTSDLGLFVEDDWTLGALTLTAGARADRYVIADGFYSARDGANLPLEDHRFANRSGWEGSPRGGAVWRVTPALRLRAAAYSGLRLTTLNEPYRHFAVFPVTTEATAAQRNARLNDSEAALHLTQWRGADRAMTT